MTQTRAAGDGVAHVRIELAHGVAQLLCNEHGVDALHLKGLALDPSLQYDGRQSRDVDLLVRPSHIDTFRQALRTYGWRQFGRFATGSPFEHAENWRHLTLGHLDLHRLVPGIGLPPGDAFEALWTPRRHICLAGVDCAVPSLDAQSVVVLLHAARSHGDLRSRLDTEHLWHHTDAEAHERILQLVSRLRADVAFAAATGNLEEFCDRPDYLLWKVSSSPDADRTTEWWARIRAASGLRRKGSLMLRASLVNRDHLRAVRDHEPTTLELAEEFVRRATAAARELAARRKSR